ncbi:MAG: hydrogenase maturation nickel metallochaperone HypA [Thermodesulfobacteriota bacterium]
MHEMGIAMQIMDIVKSAIPKDMPDPKVSAINLKVGKLTAIVPESLRFCFTIASRDTPFADAKLVIEEVPVRVVCKECRAESVITGPDFSCSQCKSRELAIITGRELTVASIELAEPED